MSTSERINIVDGVTADGDTPGVKLDGKHALAFYGDLGAATVSFVFLTPDENNVEQETGVSADWQFSGALPGVESFHFPKDLGYLVRVTGADASTNFGINAYDLRH